MAREHTDTWKLLDGKISVPSEMRTAEWRMVPQHIRERSFYMAGVANAEILEEFRSEVAAIAAGERGEVESLTRLQQFLDGAGYQPLPGQEGTIKDLRTNRRILVALRTNVELLQGWRDKEAGLRPAALRTQPAWELVRVYARRRERLWDERFLRVGGRIIEGRRIALKTSNIWWLLGNVFPDSLGVDHAPFAWGSGMRLRGVGFREVKRLGLLNDWTPPPVKPVSSPNETLEVKPRVKEPVIREALSEHLGGLAEWRGDTLVFTDPNGTRRYTAEKLAEVWKRPMPPVFRHLPGEGQMQREALLDWAADSSLFWNDARAGEAKQGRLNWWEDFQRVLMRLKADGKEAEPLFRTLTWNTNEGLSGFLDHVRRNGYSARPETPAESWTPSISAARKYAGDARYQVLLKLPGGHSAGRNIAPLVRAFEKEIARREAPQEKLAITDAEVILPSWGGLRVKQIGRVKDTPQGKTVEIELEEVKP